MSVCAHALCVCPGLSFLEWLYTRGSCIPGGPFGGLGPGRDATLVFPCSSGMWVRVLCLFPVSGNTRLTLLVPFSKVGLMSLKHQRGQVCWSSLAAARENLCRSRLLAPGDMASTSPGAKRPLRSWAPGCLGLCPSGFAVPKLWARKWPMCPPSCASGP